MTTNASNSLISIVVHDNMSYESTTYIFNIVLKKAQNERVKIIKYLEKRQS
jgi:hypothetical protein